MHVSKYLELVRGGIGIRVLDLVHHHGRKRIEHYGCLTGEQNPSRLGISNRIRAGNMFFFPDARYILSDIEFRPELHVVGAIIPEILSTHPVVGRHETILVDDDWVRYDRRFNNGSNPWALILLHGICSNFIRPMRFDGVPDNGTNSNDFKERFPPRGAAIPACLGIVAIWWGWHNLRKNRRLFLGTCAFLFGIVLNGYGVWKFLEWSS